MSDAVTIIVSPVRAPSIVKVTTPGPQGPRGLPGEGGDTAISFEHFQDSPLATWTISIPNTFTRKPAVDIYLEDGTQVDADVAVTSSHVTITFASPIAGSAVLT